MTNVEGYTTKERRLMPLVVARQHWQKKPKLLSNT